jgi:hypothetical protein
MLHHSILPQEQARGEMRLEHQMTNDAPEKDRPTEDDITKEKLGPRGVPGEPDNRKLTPQNEKNTPKSGEFDGHVA